MTSTAAPRPTYGSLLRARGVTPLFGLSLTTVLGMSLQILALSVVVYRQTGSALWSSAAFAAGFLPQLLGGTFLTSLADRLPAKRLLATGAAVRAADAGVLALAHVPPGIAIAVVAVVAVVQPVPSAAQFALVARLLTGETYVLGRSVFNLISSGGQLAGLAAGGAVVAGLGPSAAFGVAAAVQTLGLVGALALPDLYRPAVTASRWHLGDTWRGNADLLADRTIRRILLSWWLPTTLLVAAESLVVAYVGEQGDSASSTGILLAAFPAGAAVGDLLVGRFLPARWRRRSVPWLFGLVGIALLPLAWHPSVAVVAGCLALASAGGAYQLGGQQAFLDAVPEQRQGLAFGLVGTGIMGSQGVGPVVAGGVADLVGAGVTVTGLGVAVLVVWLFLGRLPAVVGTADVPVPAEV